MIDFVSGKIENIVSCFSKETIENALFLPLRVYKLALKSLERMNRRINF
jgi:hypothetical protein